MNNQETTPNQKEVMRDMLSRSIPDFMLEMPPVPEELFKALVEESLRVGKIVWTCDGNTQTMLSRFLMAYHSEEINGYEEMKETIARRDREENELIKDVYQQNK